jgi:ABC-type amino acid transport substrate-binding protein
LLLAGLLALPLALAGCGGGSTSTSSGTSAADASSGSASGAASTEKYVILDETVTTEHYGVGFRLEDTALRDVVEYTLVGMYGDGTVERIAAKYADEGINYDSYILTRSYPPESTTLDITTFAVGFDQDFPPYGFVDDNGDFAGFDLELAAEVAARNGWEIKYVPINWDLKDAELASGSIDCIWNGFTIEGREDQYLWTQPYMDNTQVIVVLESSGITSFADLADKVVMAQADSAAYAALNDEHPDLVASFKELRTIPEYNTAFLELDQGSVDAVAIDRPVAVYQMSAHS